MKKYEHVRRLNLELGAQAVRALDELQAATESSSQAEAIRLALQTVAKMVKEARAGAKVIIRRRDGTEIEVLLPVG